MSIVVMDASELAALIAQAVADGVAQAIATVRPGPAVKAWLTMAEAAQRLGVSRNTVYLWICQGAIPADAVLKTGKMGKRRKVATRWVMTHIEAKQGEAYASGVEKLADPAQGLEGAAVAGGQRDSESGIAEVKVLSHTTRTAVPRPLDGHPPSGAKP